MVTVITAHSGDHLRATAKDCIQLCAEVAKVASVVASHRIPRTAFASLAVMVGA